MSVFMCSVRILCSQCRAGNLPTVRYLIEEGCNAEAVDEDGSTALHAAAK